MRKSTAAAPSSSQPSPRPPIHTSTPPGPAATPSRGVFLDGEGVETLREHDVTLVTTGSGCIEIGHPLRRYGRLREELDTHKQTQRQARDACLTVAGGTDFGLPCFPRGNVNHEVVASSSTVASRHLRRLRPVRKRPPRRSPRRRGGLEAVRYADLVVDGDKVECV